jgi:hypothetical protein
MPSNWRKQIGKRRDVKLIETSLRRKWGALNNDKHFVLETARLTGALEHAWKWNPEVVQSFFRKFGYPSALRLREINQFIDRLQSKKLRRTFNSYVRYVARFGVLMKLRERRPYFKPYPLAPVGNRFHVKIESGHLIPVVKSGFGPNVEFFEVADLPILRKRRCGKRIQPGEMKVVQVDDNEGGTILSELENFAYDSDGITLVAHRTAQPYLMCLIGERVTNEAWRKASTVVSAFLCQLYGRGKAGRPVDIKRFQRALALPRKPGPLKVKATSLRRGDSEKQHSSAEAYAVRTAKLLGKEIPT